MNMNKHLIYNSVHCCKCGDNIQSYHVHDYKMCTCWNAMVDGGLEYERWGWQEEGTVINFSLYMEDHPFSIIRQYYYRWNHIKKTYVLLKDIDDEWLENILKFYIPSEDQHGEMKDEYLLLFLMEKQYRNEEEE